ncbi:sugar ABC transporter ATP-binding protein [Cytobacillus firmus]|uniref:Putative ABC transporter ATP-binding protein n=1 Tax=Cytobacillus firmus DS1 TaxID=1307436 RepID=W7L4B5_CYTFI|nr:sugar ABC transporter ATP-binding protein [Cytobacillus firmus]EWG10002.1 putative ABC transporter ATP-binding protein [Cytobacillus firmus DS1]
MESPLIQLENITKSFGGVKALKGVSLTIQPGEIHCLAGENGCGKSTLIKVMSGVHTPDHGQIFINGKKYKHLSPLEAIKEGIQVIYQDFSIFPNLTVAENIALGSELSAKRKVVSWPNMRRIAKEALSKINVDLELNEKVENLSVADKQLIAISRALMQKAKLIVMDEPTTALTHKEVDALFKVINGLKQDGISVLFVSHKLEEIFAISERITILRNGSNVISEQAKNMDTEKLVYHMTGRKLQDKYYDVDVKNKVPILRTDKFGLDHSFENVSIEIYPGEIVGLTGLLGSGRTELAESLFGLLPATSGRVFINSKEIKIDSVQKAVKEKIVYVPEDRLTEGLFLEQSIERNIIASTVVSLLTKLKMLNQDKINQSVENWIDKLGVVTHSSKLPVKALSGGNQQKVVLAKWLSSNPNILILNGPTVGVDIGAKEDIHNIIKDLAKDGLGVLLISDDLTELRQNCNRVLVMNKGRISGEVRGRDFNQKTWSELQEA